MDKDKKLALALLDKSLHEEWHQAKDEWEIFDLYYFHYDGVCVCGQSRIKKMVVLRNKVNNKFLKVGSCCCQKILNMPVDNLITTVLRFKNKPWRSLNNPRFVKYFLDKGIISFNEFGFYMNTINKRGSSLSLKQYAWRVSINKRILAYITKEREY